MRFRPAFALVFLLLVSVWCSAAFEEGHPIEAQLCSSWALEQVDLPRSELSGPHLQVFRGLFFLSDFFHDAGVDPPMDMLISEDLEHWNLVKIPIQTPRVDIAWGNGVFIGVNYSPNYIISRDGYNWEARPIPGGTPFRIFWTGEEFMMVSEGGAFFSSTDGETWDRAATAPIHQFLSQVAWSGREWVVTDVDDRLVSSDLEHWERIRGSEKRLVWGNRRFLIHSSSSPIELSDDGDRSPQAMYIPYSEMIGDNDFFTMQTNNQFVGGRFVFVALGTYDGRAYFRFYASEDGLTWYQQPLDLLERDLPVFVTIDDDIVRYGRNLMVLATIRNSTSGDVENFFLKGDCPEISGVTVVPGAAHSEGVGDSRWRTDLSLQSRAPGTDEILLEFLPWNRPASKMIRKWITVRGGRSMRLEDVIGTIFDYEGAGTLWIWPQSAQLAVMARTWEEQHRNGQGVPHLDWTDSLSWGEHATLCGLQEDAEDRTNLGLINLEESSIDIVLELSGDSGEELGRIEEHLRPRESVQLNSVLSGLSDAPVEPGSVEIWTTTEGGRFLAYASRIDNTSQDPVWIEPTAAVPPLPAIFGP